MKADIDIIFGKRIADIRKSKGLSQERLAEMAGLHRTYVGALERGEKSPTLATIDRLAKGFDMKIKEIFDYEA